MDVLLESPLYIIIYQSGAKCYKTYVDDYINILKTVVYNFAHHAKKTTSWFIKMLEF